MSGISFSGLVRVGNITLDDEDDGPHELPNGRLVCGPHGLGVCGICCVDYSFMEEVLDDGGDDEVEDEDEDQTQDDDSDDWSGAGRRVKKGTGRAFPTKFVPPTPATTPEAAFSGNMRHMNVIRHTLPNDASKGLIRTDGACLNNGQENPKAGWAFWHGYSVHGEQLIVSGRLEKKGPFGDKSDQTSNRAELRAVIAALRFRFWPGEGFRTLVFATDSEYVVEGATKWAKSWVKYGWVKRNGGAVKNRDLWEALLGEVEYFKDNGTNIAFWRIPREWNTVADVATKEAAANEEASARWADIIGINL